MTEWGVVGVITSMIALFAAIATPIMKLTRAITKLSVAAENLERRVWDLGCDNKVEHEKFEHHNKEQDEKLDEHGNRITALEARRKARATT